MTDLATESPGGWFMGLVSGECSRERGRGSGSPPGFHENASGYASVASGNREPRDRVASRWRIPSLFQHGRWLRPSKSQYMLTSQALFYWT